MDKKAIIFIDANNWYHNLKYYFKPSSVDICKFGDIVSKKYELDILEIRWYTSVPDIEDNKLKYIQHMSFLSNLQKQKIKVITRKLQKLSTKELKKKRKEMVESWDLCEVCKPIVDEAFLDIADNQKKEKGIDVWIAVDMVKEAIQENVDCCVLISGDADFVPAFNLIKEIGKDVLSVSVPRGYSNELRQKFPYLVLKKEELNKCLKDYRK
ncbi:NYN domain-containing protein [Candidatus Pacearchaeota archaeon]|nr:NYN domain-containing protein [Candidatus Pacearchaeota archaeon]